MARATAVAGFRPSPPPPHARNPALYATVTGRVFCDRCNDGERNGINEGGLDVPLAHAVVELTCYSTTTERDGRVFDHRLSSYRTATNSAGFYNFSSKDGSTFAYCLGTIANTSNALPPTCSTPSPVIAGCGRHIALRDLHAGGTYYAGQYCTTYPLSLPECDWQDSNIQCAKRLVYNYDGDGTDYGRGFIQFFDATVIGNSGGLLYSSPDSRRTFYDKSVVSSVVGDTMYWLEAVPPEEFEVSVGMVILSTRADYVRQPPKYALGPVTTRVPPFRVGTSVIFNFDVDTSELPDNLYFFFAYSTRKNQTSNEQAAIYSAAAWRDNPLKVYETDNADSSVIVASSYIGSVSIDVSVSPSKLYWIEETSYLSRQPGYLRLENTTSTLKRASVSRSRSTLTYIQTLYSMTTAPSGPFTGIFSFQVDPVHKLVYAQLVFAEELTHKPFLDAVQYLAVFDISVNPPRRRFTRRIGMNLYSPLVDIYSSPPVLYGVSGRTAYKMRLNLTSGSSAVLTHGPRLSIGVSDQLSLSDSHLNLLYGDDCVPPA
eukprot:jgi/Chlat1/663/Chrsp103S01063